MGSFTRIRPASASVKAAAPSGTFARLRTGETVSFSKAKRQTGGAAANQDPDGRVKEMYRLLADANKSAAAPKGKRKTNVAAATANQDPDGRVKEMYRLLAAAREESQLKEQARQARANLDTDTLNRVDRQLKELQAARDPEPYSLGTSLKNMGKKGLHAIAQAGADTLALGEDLALAPFEAFSGMELGSLSDKGPLNTWAGKIREESEETNRKAQANMEKGGLPARLLEGVGSAAIAAVPNAALAMFTGGGSAAAQTTAGLTRAAAAQSPGVAATLSRAAGSMARNPQYWTSFGQTVGSSYEDALAEQREMGAASPARAGTSENKLRTKAMLYAMGNGLLGAAVEVGGGIETLPGELRGGKNVWRAFVDSMVDEGREEVVQGVIERALKNPVYGAETPFFSATDGRAIFNPRTAAKEFAGGAAVGGILGGGQIGISKALDVGRAAGRPVREAGRSFTAAQNASDGAVDMGKELEKFTLRDTAAQPQGPAESEFYLPEEMEKDIPAPGTKETTPRTGAAVIADTSLFEPTILKNFNTARKKLVEFARAHFPAEVVNAETGKTIGISRIGIDKFLSGNIPYEKYASGFHIPELIERAHKVGDANNYHPETAGAIPTFEYYDSPIEIDGKSFNAHIRVKNTQIGDKYYGHTVSEIEDIKIEPPTRSSVPGNPAVHPENTGGSMGPSARTSAPGNPAVQPVNAIDNPEGESPASGLPASKETDSFTSETAEPELSPFYITIPQGADFVKPGDDGPGINPFYFSDLSRSLAAMLQQGNTKTVTDKLDGVWGELSARQREKIRALLNRYGVKYKM